METLHDNPDSLAANGKVFFKHVDEQLKHELTAQKKMHKLSQRSTKKTTLFLVDDDPMFLKGLELSISGNLGSLKIDTFQTGEDCLRHLHKKPAIVILDYYLNSEKPFALDGFHVLKEIKRLHPKTKVIMLSSQDSLNIAIDCIDNGAYDYISKSHSSLVRINNIIKNITGDMEATSDFYKILQYTLVFILFVCVLALLLNH